MKRVYAAVCMIKSMKRGKTRSNLSLEIRPRISPRACRPTAGRLAPTGHQKCHLLADICGCSTTVHHELGMCNNIGHNFKTSENKSFLLRQCYVILTGISMLLADSGSEIAMSASLGSTTPEREPSNGAISTCAGASSSFSPSPWHISLCLPGQHPS